MGFLHEMNSSKSSLVYDLQEPFRFLVYLVVINFIKNGIMDKRCFIVTENYSRGFESLKTESARISQYIH